MAPKTCLKVDGLTFGRIKWEEEREKTVEKSFENIFFAGEFGEM